MSFTEQDLFDAGLHIGHQKRRWNPRSKAFIFEHREVSIINLEKTKEALINACEFIERLVASGKNILFVGTKKQAQDILKEAAISVDMPYCTNRWMGGTLTNYATIKQSLNKYKNFLKLEADGSLEKLPKKEASAIRRQMNRMHRNFEGLIKHEKLPHAMFVIDIKSEYNAIAEARKLGIPVIGLVDTNSDPALVDYPIPGNDDAVKSIRMIVEIILDAVQNGLSKREVVHKEHKKEVINVRKSIEQDSQMEPEVTLSEELVNETQEEANEEASKARKANA